MNIDPQLSITNAKLTEINNDQYSNKRTNYAGSGTTSGGTLTLINQTLTANTAYEIQSLSVGTTTNKYLDRVRIVDSNGTVFHTEFSVAWGYVLPHKITVEGSIQVIVEETGGAITVYGNVSLMEIGSI